MINLYQCTCPGDPKADPSTCPDACPDINRYQDMVPADQVAALSRPNDLPAHTAASANFAVFCALCPLWFLVLSLCCILSSRDFAPADGILLGLVQLGPAGPQGPQRGAAKNSNPF